MFGTSWVTVGTGLKAEPVTVVAPEAWLLVETGSKLTVDTDAVNPSEPAKVGVTATVTVAELPLARFPRSQ